MKSLVGLGLLLTASGGLSSNTALFLTALAGLITATMAVVAWRGSRRLQVFQRQEAEREAASQKLTEHAELLHAEHEGWLAIIREQRQHGRELEGRLLNAERERKHLSEELHDALDEIMRTREEMDRVRRGLTTRIQELEARLERRGPRSPPRQGGRRKADPK